MGENWTPPKGILCGSIQACRELSTGLKAFHARSPFGWLFERTFAWAQFISPATWLWGTRAYSHGLADEVRDRFEVWRSKRVDWYIFAWAVALVISHVVVGRVRMTAVACVVCTLAILRILDIIQANVNMHLLDGIRVSTRSHHVASLVRSSLISVWNYVELVGWYAVLYFLSRGLKGDGDSCASLFDATYFSTITQLTIGFGDLKPGTTVGRLLAMIQGLLGTLFLVFAISRFSSLLPQVRDHGARTTPSRIVRRQRLYRGELSRAGRRLR